MLVMQLLQGGWTGDDINYWDGFRALHSTSGVKKNWRNMTLTFGQKVLHSTVFSTCLGRAQQEEENKTIERGRENYVSGVK